MGRQVLVQAELLGTVAGGGLASIEHLKADEFTEFILARRHELAAREQKFIESLGIKSADKEVGETDIDTE